MRPRPGLVYCYVRKFYTIGTRTVNIVLHCETEVYSKGILSEDSHVGPETLRPGKRWQKYASANLNRAPVNVILM